MRKFILPAVLVVLAAIWEFLVQFTFMDAILTKLRAQGAGGVLLANFLASPTAIWAFIIVAAVLVIAGIRESRKHTRLQSNEAAQILPEKQWYETPESDLMPRPYSFPMDLLKAQAIAGILRPPEPSPDPNIVCLGEGDLFVEIDQEGVFRDAGYGESNLRAIAPKFVNEPKLPNVKRLEQPKG